MEGLLPLVYKAIKKNRTRRHYECLSSYNGINMAEIYPQNHNQTNQRFDGGDDRVLDAERSIGNHHHHHHHRRHKSVGDFENGFQSPPQMMRTGDSSPPKQLVRFRSQRMFSCITGA